MINQIKRELDIKMLKVENIYHLDQVTKYHEQNMQLRLSAKLKESTIKEVLNTEVKNLVKLCNDQVVFLGFNMLPDADPCHDMQLHGLSLCYRENFIMEMCKEDHEEDGEFKLALMAENHDINYLAVQILKRHLHS